MKYKIQFILHNKISTDRVRDIKLSLLQDSVDMFIVSDYPVFIPDDYIYLSDIKFKIILKEVKISADFHTVEVTILDCDTIKIRDKEKWDKDRERLSDMFIKIMVYMGLGVIYTM